MLPNIPLHLSGERFRVVYKLTGTEAEARARADHLCVEQTVEYPAELLPEGDIRAHIVARLEALTPLDDRHFEAEISFAVETAGWELTQLINVMFGNISLAAGVRVERLELPPALLSQFRGPRFGSQGLRGSLGVPARPLLCTAIKPMGLPVWALAEMAYKFALGGVDIVKDDHGLADQALAPFKARIDACTEAVARANRETGGRSIYAPCVTAPVDRVLERALYARAAGAGGLLIAPGIVGFDTMRMLADDDRVALPILSHPTFLGTFTAHPENGFSTYALFGQLIRLAGGDASIYVNYGGRFASTPEDCRLAVEGCAVPMGHIRPILPVPAGGSTLKRVPETIALHGRDLILLIGGDLHRYSGDLVESSRHFRALVEAG